MHIHPNNNLLLASIGAGREEAQEIAAKRAAEVRRKLSTASHASDTVETESYGVVTRVAARTYEAEQRDGRYDDDSFGRLFSAKA